MKRQAKSYIEANAAHKLYATLVNERCANIGKRARIDAGQVASWNVNLNFIISKLQSLSTKQKIEALDLGCGYGFLTQSVCSLGASTVGIDTDRSVIEYASQTNRFPDRTAYMNIPVEELSGEKIFDVIIISEVLEHVSAPDMVMMHCHRLLKDNGSVLLTIPNKLGPRECVEQLLLPVRESVAGRSCVRFIRRIAAEASQGNLTAWDVFTDDYHKRFFQMPALVNIFSCCGFQMIEYQNQDALASLWGTLFPWFDIGPGLLKLDYKIADALPYYIAGGWMIVLEKRKKHSASVRDHEDRYVH
jgi:2-polyprenyl-3-methyl-5-hydroxy-6-metoxy-1,4-benzoquinol methylase